MAFRPKNIFLADDDNTFRMFLRQALEKVGHNVLVEARNGDEARSFVPQAVEMGIEAAVLDCHMPNKTDGPQIAEALNLLIPQLLVVSISDHWSGIWPDPNYDGEHRHPANVDDFDLNGRTQYRSPDFSARDVRFDNNAIARLIGEWEFSLVSQEGMRSIGEIAKMNTRWAERK